MQCTLKDIIDESVQVYRVSQEAHPEVQQGIDEIRNNGNLPQVQIAGGGFGEKWCHEPNVLGTHRVMCGGYGDCVLLASQYTQAPFDVAYFYVVTCARMEYRVQPRTAT